MYEDILKLLSSSGKYVGRQMKSVGHCANRTCSLLMLTCTACTVTVFGTVSVLVTLLAL